MASNYTAKYKLNQWAEQDKVLRTEFNTDNARIESALAGLESGKASVAALNTLRSTVDGKASTAELNALKSVVDGKANQTQLDQVVQAAANQDKNLARRNCRAYLEPYTGTGELSRTFSFPARPWLVIFFDTKKFTYLGVRDRKECFVTGTDVQSGITFSWSGNSVTAADNTNLYFNQLYNKYTLFALLEP